MKRKIVRLYHRAMMKVYGGVARVAPGWKLKAIALSKETDHFCEFCHSLMGEA